MLKTNAYQALLDKQFVKWSVEQLYIQWQYFLAKQLVLNQFQQIYSKQLQISESRYAAGQDNGLERLNMQNWVAQNEQSVFNIDASRGNYATKIQDIWHNDKKGLQLKKYTIGFIKLLQQ